MRRPHGGFVRPHYKNAFKAIAERATLMKVLNDMIKENREYQDNKTTVSGKEETENELQEMPQYA